MGLSRQVWLCWGMCGRFSIYATSQELADGTLCELLAPLPGLPTDLADE